MTKEKENLPFPLVGIGASAGGLEALQSFFGSLSDSTRMAYVVIQHLDPTHESMMASLLSRHTDLNIGVIQDGQQPQPGWLYLNPPDRNVALVGGLFRLSAISSVNKGFYRIDHFFRSLALDQGRNAVCVVLSGTGSDGAIGLREVKSAGGFSMVQEAAQAGFSSMPQSAINTGQVDLILPTEQMAEQMAQYVQHPYLDGLNGAGEQPLVDTGRTVQELFALLRKHTGQDFSKYKPSTIYRRIERRMAVHQIDRMEDYLEYVQQNRPEVDLLFRDLLITVTSFFRNHEAFEVLKKGVLPDLLDTIPEDTPLRIWVPGCATGEEAYSLGILLIEVMEAKNRLIDCKLFASDVDITSIEFARAAVYPESIEADVSEERLERFFVLEDHQYHVKKRLRDMVVFAEQDLLSDPPFSRVDLISCRNVLIYLNQEMHERVFQIFHRALKNNGAVFLGASESISGYENLFSSLSDQYNVVQKKPGSDTNITGATRIPKPYPTQLSVAQSNYRPKKQDSIQELVERTILDHYTDPCVVVNNAYDILFVFGDTDPYLTMPKGKASLNILNVTRETLRYQLLTVLKEAAGNGKSVRRNNIQLLNDQQSIQFDLLAHPLSLAKGYQQATLVVFKAQTDFSPAPSEHEELLEDDDTQQRIRLMEEELQNTRESLQATIEELESSNEELQSKNEELQSSIEELETAKEEAQSTNEELISVNAELKQKIADLAEANNDIDNLLASTDIATVFLNDELRIKRFTPAMSQVFNLISTDIGRPISDITSNIKYQDIYQDAMSVLETLEKQEKELETDSGSWFAVRIIPYRTTENLIDGVVITFVDITPNKRLEEATRLAAVVEDSNDAITVLDPEGNITAWNEKASLMYGYGKREALQMNIQALLPADRPDEINTLYEQVQRKQATPSFETRRIAKDGSVVDVWLTVTALMDQHGKTYSLATTEHAISDENS